MSFPAEAARDVLGILRAMWLTEPSAHRRRELAAAGHQVRQALELAASDPDADHALVNVALRGVQSSMKYHDPIAVVFNAAVERVRAK